MSNIEVRVALGEDDFRRLVMGRVIETEAKVRGTPFFVQIALQDIGFDRMTLALRDAIEGAAVTAMTKPAEEPPLKPVDEMTDQEFQERNDAPWET
jgi:hypothetical protein